MQNQIQPHTKISTKQISQATLQNCNLRDKKYHKEIMNAQVLIKHETNKYQSQHYKSFNTTHKFMKKKTLRDKVRNASPIQSKT